jgi:hypothetical protein
MMPVFDDDDVVPVIPEVVHVIKAAGVHAEGIVQDDALFVDVANLVIEIRVGIAIADPVDHKLVEMAVGPAEGGLEDPMELRQLNSRGHDEPAPYDRRYIE